MIDSKIGCIWLINNINWPIKALSAQEIVKKALKEDKNNILHTCLRYMSETQSKRIVSIVNDIDDNQIKICFYESYIDVKITQNLSIKPMSKVTTKLGRVYIDLWGPSPNISPKGNYYI